MTDELQSGSLDSDESLDTENLHEQGAELATDSDTQHEPKAEVETESNHDQDAVQKAINKQHAKYREEERKRLEVERQLEEYKRKEQEKEASKYNSLPERPDPFDDDYDAKFAQYEQALRDKAAFDAKQQFEQQQQQQFQQQEQARLQQEIQATVQSYEQRATEFGVDVQEVRQAGDVLVQAGINEQLADALLKDPDGPLLTKYLAANLADLEQLQGNPYLAASKMAEIKEKAQALKPKNSNAPEPPTRVEGKAVDLDANKYQHVQGAFE